MLFWALPLALLLGYVIILSLILGYTSQVFNKIQDMEFDTTKEHLTFVRNLCIALFVIVCIDTGFNYWRQYKTGRFATELTGWDDIHTILSGLSVVVGIVGLVLSSIGINAMDTAESTDVEKVKSVTRGILITISVFFVLCFIQKIVYFEIFKQQKLVIKKTFKKYQTKYFPQKQKINQQSKADSKKIQLPKEMEESEKQKEMEEWKLWNESKEKQFLLESQIGTTSNDDPFGDEIEKINKIDTTKNSKLPNVIVQNYQNPYKIKETDSLDDFSTLYDSDNDSESAFDIKTI